MIEFKDKTGPGFAGVEKQINRLENAAQKGSDALNKMGQTAKASSANAGSAMKGMGESARQAAKETKAAEKTNSHYEKSMQKLEKQTRKLYKSFLALAKEKIQILLEVKDKLTPYLAKVRSWMKSFTGKVWNLTIKVTDIATASIRGVLKLLKDPLLKAGKILGIDLELNGSIDAFKEFEAAMSQVKVISGASAPQFEKLTEKAKEMGVTTKFTATEAANALSYLGTAGWNSQDMLGGIEGIMNLAAASGEELGTVSAIVTETLAAFGLQAYDSGHFADVLAQASANANTTVSLLGQAFKDVAPVAGAMKYSVEDTSFALGLMANASIRGSAAGTSLKTALDNLASPTKQIQEAMQRYGISMTDSSGETKSLKGVMDNLRSSLGGLSETQQKAAASTIFGEEAMAGMLAIIKTSPEEYERLAEAIGHADGASKRMADTMGDNLKGSLEILQGSVEEVKLSFGERLSPYIRQFAEWLADMMPAVEEGMNHLMDYIDEKIDWVKKEIATFTATADWKNADFFGKVSISWDRLIATPFMSWWKSTGSNMVSDVMSSLGRGIGTGISITLSTLFGIDVSSVAGEGASIGGAFAGGLMEGLGSADLSGLFTKAVGGVFKSAGKLLPGGAKADLGSVFSTMLIAKMGTSLVKGVRGIGSLFVPTLAPASSPAGVGGAGGTFLRRAIGGFSVAPEVSGTGLAGGTGLLGIAGKAGIMLGSGATSSAGLIMSGGGAIAGGVIGGATLISGGADLYRGFQSNDKKEKDAYTDSGIYKVGGVASGALTGAIIGGIIPVIGPAIGALVGSGIGGILGKMKGDSVIKDYEQEAEAAQKAEAEAALKQSKAFITTGKAVEDVKFGVKELDKAFKDSSVSAEEFSKMYKRAVDDNLKNHFGDIKLSMEEIKELATTIVLGDNAPSLVRYQEATAIVKQRVEELQDTLGNLERMEWKASIGVELSGDDKKAYTQEVETYITQMKRYAEDNLYVSHTARATLLGEEKASKYDGADNEAYAAKQKEIEALEKQAKESSEKGDIIGTNKYLDEIAVLTGTKDATDPMSRIEKWGQQGLGALEPDSLLNFAAGAAEQLQFAHDTYTDALAAGLENSGSVEESQALRKGASQKMAEAEARLMELLFGALESTYGGELSTVLPEGVDIAGTLQARLYDALSKGENVSEWSPEDVANWLGLQNLEPATQDAIAAVITQIAQTIPQSTIDILKESSGGEEITPVATALGMQLTGAFMGIDMTLITTALQGGLSSAYDKVDLSESAKAMRNNAEQALKTALATPFNIVVQANLNTKIKWFGLGSPGLPTVMESEEKPKQEPIKGYVHYEAHGGFVSGKQLSWVGEEGPEAIIPLVPSRRQRAIDLYERAGRILGLGGNAEGGIIGSPIRLRSSTNLAMDNVIQLYPKGFDSQPYMAANELTEGYSVGDNSISVSTGAALGNVTVEVHFTQQIDISATDRNEQEIKRMIKSTVKDMTDDLGVALAEKVNEAFGNMPKAQKGV